jgi:oligopeptide transport system substrate-binding protein
MKTKLFNYFIVSLVLSFSSCSKEVNEKKSPSSHKITINIQEEPSTLDHRKARLMFDYNTIRTFNDGLFRTGRDGKAAPAIAESYTVSEDMKTYVFKLKKTNWSNGVALSAHDFIYSWKSSLNKNFPAPNAALLFPIKNAKEIKEGALPASMLGVYADGDLTLVVELERPVPFFTDLLTIPIYFPLNESVDQAHPDWSTSADHYVCSGPFKMVDWKHKNEILAEKNKYYWDTDQVKIQNITMVMVDPVTAFSMQQNGELSWVGAPYSNFPPEALEMLKANKTLQKDPFLATNWIRTNTNYTPLNNREFRQSLAFAINRKDITQHVLQGEATVATGIVPISMGIQEKPYFTDNDEKMATELLSIALKKMNLTKETLPQLKLTFACTENSDKIATAIQDNWRKVLGINVILEPVESKIYIDKIGKGDYQLACGRWGADFNDPISFLDVFKTRSSGTNNTGWESPDYISAIEDTYKYMDFDKRKSGLAKAEQILINDMPVIPVYHFTMLHVQDPSLKDIVLTQCGEIDFKYAYFSK